MLALKAGDTTSNTCIPKGFEKDPRKPKVQATAGGPTGLSQGMSATDDDPESKGSQNVRVRRLWSTWLLLWRKAL